MSNDPPATSSATIPVAKAVASAALSVASAVLSAVSVASPAKNGTSGKVTVTGVVGGVGSVVGVVMFVGLCVGLVVGGVLVVRRRLPSKKLCPSQSNRNKKKSQRLQNTEYHHEREPRWSANITRREDIYCGRRYSDLVN